MAIDRVLAGNEAVGVVLALVVLALARANRPFLRDVFADGEAAWRGLARLAALTLGITVVWVSALDKWRQLLDEPMRRLGQFPAERVVLDPTPAPVRTVSLALLVTLALLVAPLVARHVGGYGIQIAGAIAGTLLAMPLYTLRVRFDFGLALGFDADPGNPLDLAGYGLYLVVTWAFLAGTMLLLFTGLTFLVALPMTLLLDLTGRRAPRVTHEADPFFAALTDRVAARDSGPGPSSATERNGNVRPRPVRPPGDG